MRLPLAMAGAVAVALSLAALGLYWKGHSEF